MADEWEAAHQMQRASSHAAEEGSAGAFHHVSAQLEISRRSWAGAMTAYQKPGRCCSHALGLRLVVAINRHSF